MAGSTQANAVSWPRRRAVESSNRARDPISWKACRISAPWCLYGRSASRESPGSSPPDMPRLHRRRMPAHRAICNPCAGYRRRSTTASPAMIEQPVGPPDLFDQPDLFDRPGSVDERRAVDPPRPVGRPGAAAEPDPADRSAPVDQPDPADRSDPVDQPARRRAIEATGSVLVQAPAGSGKTTLLAQRYLRLLATVDAPERILALTFTRRAAQEMRERVLQALHAAGASDRPAQMNAQTWELGVAARRRMSELGFDLVRHPSRLRIETIDAFNTWLAGQLPVTAGAGARLNLTDDPRPLYEEAARRAMAHDEADQFGHAVERVLAQDDQRWESLVRLISGMLASRDRWLPLLAGHLHATRTLDELQLRNIRRQLDEDLRLLVTRSLTAAHQAIGPERLQ